MTFVKIQTQKGATYWVRPDLIKLIVGIGDEITQVYFNEDRDPILINTSCEKVVELLKDYIE